MSTEAMQARDELVVTLQRQFNEILATINKLTLRVSPETANRLRPEIATIKKEVGVIFEMPDGYESIKQRSTRYAWPRMVALSLCSKLTDYNTEEIAISFRSDMHRANVYYASKAVENRRMTDPKFAAIMDTVETRCKAALKL